MTRNELIRQYYLLAKEFIIKNKPKEARMFVLKILNEGVDILKTTKSIPLKDKTEILLKKWIYVSKNLYSYGVTDYVLDCFGLYNKPEISEKQESTKKDNEPNNESIIDDKLNMEGLFQDDSYDDKQIDVKSKVQLDNIKKGDIIVDDVFDNKPDSLKNKEVLVDNSNWCSNIFKENIRSVVEIYASDESGLNVGSGFIISKNGYLLTNNHVLVSKQTGKYCDEVFFQFSNDLESEKSIRLNIIETDKDSDIALCKFDTNDVKKFTVVKKINDYSKEVNQGDDCMIIGNPFGLGLAPVRGCIRYVKDSYGDLVYAASTNVGDSGGAVFNVKGECIGINKSNTKEIDNIEVNGFSNATSMETINYFINKWLKE